MQINFLGLIIIFLFVAFFIISLEYKFRKDKQKMIEIKTKQQENNLKKNFTAFNDEDRIRLDLIAKNIQEAKDLNSALSFKDIAKRVEEELNDYRNNKN